MEFKVRIMVLILCLCGVLLCVLQQLMIVDVAHKETETYAKPEVTQAVQAPVRSALDEAESFAQEVHSERSLKQSIYEIWTVPETIDLQSTLTPMVEPVLPVNAQSSVNVPFRWLESNQHSFSDTGTSFDYSYQGSDDDKHAVRLGVKSNGIAVRTDLKGNADGTEIQYIEIEVDLPK